jgi:hypothetical protein
LKRLETVRTPHQFPQRDLRGGDSTARLDAKTRHDRKPESIWLGTLTGTNRRDVEPGTLIGTLRINSYR